MKKLKCTTSALKIRETPKGTDTGFRLVSGQVVASYGVSYDEGWAYVRTNNESGWSSLDYLEEVPEWNVENDWPKVPHGKRQIKELFGEPGKPYTHSGAVNLPSSLPLSWDLNTTIRRFRCHEKLSEVFQSVFNEIYKQGLWEHLNDFGGCYQYRPARNLSKLSTHSWGIAVDVDVNDNPLGADPVIDDRIVVIFEDHGFLWGGRWSRPDGMHFQYATGY